MSDSRRVHRAIKKAVKPLYPKEPQGNLARHLEPLAFMVRGIVLSKSCQLPKIASKVPGVIHPDRRVKPMSRWVQNEHITLGLYFLPFVQPLLTNLAAARPLVVLMDGSAMARGCVTLMVSLIYAKRAIPIARLVIEGTKSAGARDRHRHLSGRWRIRQPRVAGRSGRVWLGLRPYATPAWIVKPKRIRPLAPIQHGNDQVAVARDLVELKALAQMKNLAR